MRMICPNCGAQYEVDDAVIPEQGRDVQCSNCGHTWFQRPAHLDADLAEELNQDMPAPAEAGDDGEAEAAPLQRRGLDPEIASVLRQEAEHDAELRRADADGLETQPDLGLDDAAEIAASRSAAARARMARLRGIDETSADAEAAAAGLVAAGGSRRDLLPDVEEINSTLRASEDRTEDEDQAEQADEPIGTRKKRSSSKLLSRLILLVVILGVVVYLFAPQIIAALPQSEPYMVQYVDWANGVRAQINAGISVVSEKVQGLIGQYITGE